MWPKIFDSSALTPKESNDSPEYDHQLIVAVQDGESVVIDCEGEFFEADVSCPITKRLGMIGLDDWPEPDHDGLWRLKGEVKYDPGSTGPTPREPSNWMTGSAVCLISGEVVDFDIDENNGPFPY